MTRRNIGNFLVRYTSNVEIYARRAVIRLATDVQLNSDTSSYDVSDHSLLTAFRWYIDGVN